MPAVTTRVWYLDASRAAINWGTAVVNGRATSDILRLVSRDDDPKAPRVTAMWAPSGTTVSPARVAAAQAETSADPIPAEPTSWIPPARPGLTLVDETTILPPRDRVAFKGLGVQATDDGSQTVVTVLNPGAYAAKTSKAIRRGINSAGGEFGSNVPGVYGIDWKFDGQASFSYLASRGIRLIRLPFLWERLQPTLGGALDAGNLNRLRQAVDAINAAGMTCILDCHNYAAYNGVKLNQPGGPTGAYLGDLWRRLSDVFREHAGVVGYGLMNEPNSIPSIFSSRQGRYTFDTDIEGWGVDGSATGTTVAQSTSTKHDGAGALVGTKDFLTGNGQVFRLSDKRGSTTHDYTGPGVSLSAWVMVPVGTAGTGHQARIEVQDSGFTYRTGTAVNLTPGTWARVTWTDTGNYLASARSIVVQFSGNFASAGTMTAYVDTIQQGDATTGVQQWKDASQTALTAIRNNGDPTCVMVGGYSFSGIQSWVSNHGASGWITDPLDNFRYEGHHYWDGNHSGTYTASYTTENTTAATAGFGTTYGDALTTRTVTELNDWITWLANNNAKGYIGEFGWPWATGTNASDATAWNALAEKWYQVLDANAIWATVWATGEFWSQTYNLLVYGKASGVISNAKDQAAVVERHLGSGASPSAAGGSYVTSLALDPDALASADSTMLRTVATGTSQQTAGVLRLSFFTARRDMPALTKLRSVCTTAGTGATLAKMGLYLVDASGNLTLIASCASDTALWTVANTRYEKTTAASYAIVAGQRLAFGVLQVGGTAPTLAGRSMSGSTAAQTEFGLEPRLSATVSGLTDLPSSIAVGSLVDAGSQVYGVCS